MSQMVKEIQSSVLTRLDKVIQGKKDVLKRYQLDRSRSDLDYTCSKDEVKRLSDVYRVSVKEATKIRSKLDELSNKGKGDKEWRKMKEKLDKTCLKLHATHNDYVLSVRVANAHQSYFHDTIVPYLLNSMQNLQEGYVEEM